MNSFRTIVAFAFLLWMSAGVASADGNTIPHVFDFKFGGGPLWISAADAITPAGTLRSDIRLPEHLKLQLAQWHEKQASSLNAVGSNSQIAAESCDVSYGHYFNEGPDEGVITSVDALYEVVATRSVISGTVTDSALGIHDGIPYTILQIDEDSSARVYLLYPRGHLRFEGMTFCNDDPSFSEVPAIGDPIVFIASDAVDSTGTLFTTSWVVYEQRSTVVSSQGLQLEPAARPKSVRGFAKGLRAAQHREKRQ